MSRPARPRKYRRAVPDGTLVGVSPSRRQAIYAARVLTVPHRNRIDACKTGPARSALAVPGVADCDPAALLQEVEESGRLRSRLCAFSETLTPAQRRVWDLWGRGATLQASGDVLGVSRQAVESMRLTIARRLRERTAP